MPARIPDADEKQRLYAEVELRLNGLLDGESDPLVIMTSVVAVLHEAMPHYFWTGFYRVVGDELVIGPYQGPPACLRIAKGRGVCGATWEKAETIVVQDVHAFPGHIACDARSASEIVVPWKGANGEVIAVLDVDSTLLAAFDEIDRESLERILVRLSD
jgi:GAF domain-containing protein